MRRWGLQGGKVAAAELGRQFPARIAHGGPEGGDGVGAHRESELEFPKVSWGEDVVGVLRADFDFGEFGGEGPPDVWLFVVVAGEGGVAELEVFQGGGESRVSVGESAGVGFVVVEVLEEFEAWEVLERVSGVVSGVEVSLLPCEFGLVGRVFAKRGPQREWFV